MEGETRSITLDDGSAWRLSESRREVFLETVRSTEGRSGGSAALEVDEAEVMRSRREPRPDGPEEPWREDLEPGE